MGPAKICLNPLNQVKAFGHHFCETRYAGFPLRLNPLKQVKAFGRASPRTVFRDPLVCLNPLKQVKAFGRFFRIQTS